MNKRILVVEDELDMREAIIETLRERGFEVIAAKNGQEGLKLALEEKPDLILLDLFMPIMGGQEMLEKLRQDPRGTDIKVIMLTALDDVQNIGEGYQNGIVEYLMKSNTSLADILNRVEYILFS